MNWVLITEKYPKAEELSDSWADMHTIDWRVSDRWLYDFFDEQEIYIHPLVEENEFTGEIRFYYWILQKDAPRISSHTFYLTRTEAEEQAFIKAFEILEAKL